MKTSLAFRILKTVFVILFFYLFFSLDAFAQADLYINNRIGLSDASTLNVNHRDGTQLQDIKRSAGVFVIDKDNKPSKFCSCNLLNNGSQNGVKYVSTAAHCLDSYNGNVQNLDGLFSFDYEMPHSLAGGNQEGDKYISGVWRVKFKILSKDVIKDLALLQITEYDDRLFQNAYAAGWDNSIGTWDEIYAEIAHPEGDHKKGRIKPGQTDFMKFINSVKVWDFYAYRTYGLWNAKVQIIREGASGSGLFSKRELLKAVNSNSSGLRSTTFSHISNAWFGHISGFNQKFEGMPFAVFLDNKFSFLNSMPGGYINDLVPLDPNANFDLNMTSGTTLSTKSYENEQSKTKLHSDVLKIMPGAFYKFPDLDLKDDDRDALFKGELGIKAGDVSHLNEESKLILSVFYLDENQVMGGAYEERLLYGVYIDNGSHAVGVLGFNKPIYWTCDQGTIPPCNRIPAPEIFNDRFTALSVHKNELLRVIRKKEGAIKDKSVKNAIIPIKVSLQNIGPDDITVQAVAYPGDVPRNALQLFRPDEVARKFNSYKYKPSRGEKSDLFINSIKVELEQYVYLDNQCVPLKKKTLQEINTGNNGGYLNLVNPNFEKHKVVASEPDCPKNKLIITLKTNSTEETQYGAWLDYYKDKKGGNNTNPAEDYTYNFVDDATPHLNEKLGIGSINGGTITIEHEVPYESELPFLDDVTPIKTRLRVAVAEHPQSGLFLKQDGIYIQGEVEDYLVNIRKTSDEDKADAIIASKAKIALSNKSQRIIQHPKPSDTSGTLDSNQNATQNLIYTGNQQGNNLVLLFSMTNQGTVSEVLSPVMLPETSILNQDYDAIDSDLDGGNAPDFDCPNPGDPSNDDDTDIDLIDFDPNNPDDWAYWQEFNTLYNNLSRIIRFWDNLRQLPPVDFIVDANGTIDYALYNQFVSYYNTIAAFKNAVDGTANVYDLMQLIYDNPEILETAVGPENASIYRNMYGFILKYQCFVDNLIEYRNNVEVALNVTNNLARVAIDLWGKVIPKSYTERTLVNNITLTEYPIGDDIGIIYQVKGDTNSTTVGVNNTGQLIYEIKNNGETKNITSTGEVQLEEEVVITTTFDNGKMSLFLNTTADGTNTLSTTTIPDYSNYTKPNNGARLGAPVDPSETNRTDLEGELHKFLLFTEVLNKTEIDIVVDGNTTNTQQARTAASDQTKNPKQEKETTPDFSIFPNPVKEELNILVEVRHAGPVSINIFDLGGRQVYEMKEPNIAQGHQLISLKNLKIAAGEYILKIQAGNVRRSEKVIFE